VNNPLAGTSDLFQFALETFHRLIREFAAYGLLANPGLEVRRGNRAVCYTDLSDGNIYVPVPDLPDADSKLQALFLGSLIGCRDDARMSRVFNQLVSWGIGDENGHHNPPR
jgi:hypothetical protein